MSLRAIKKRNKRKKKTRGKTRGRGNILDDIENKGKQERNIEKKKKTGEKFVYGRKDKQRKR